MTLSEAKTPGNVLSYIEYFQVITSLQFLDYEDIIKEYYYVPE